MKITLQQMRYMLKIAETGSMVAASRVLSVSQPSLSEAVSVVERELGFSLFTRGNTGATPTKEGMEFLGRILARARTCKERVSEMVKPSCTRLHPHVGV